MESNAIKIIEIIEEMEAKAYKRGFDAGVQKAIKVIQAISIRDTGQSDNNTRPSSPLTTPTVHINRI